MTRPQLETCTYFKFKRTMTGKFIKSIALAGICLFFQNVLSQEVTADSVMQHVKGKRLSIGGYGEIVMSRNFYSDNVYRYSRPSQYKDDPSHGRFDIPHAVIYLGYDFGKGWTFGTEIEFEHGGTGTAVEREFDEAAEWEQEVEKGGEVELEQFWIQKSFARWANVRVGHIVVPMGLNNAYHEPMNYFTVYRPEGENTILPSTWHDTGISFWGRSGDFRYELQVLAGLDAFMFNRDGWIHNGPKSVFEYKVANKYGVAMRLDNYSLPGLRFGLSGYVGNAMHNTFPHDMEGEGKRYDKIKGTVAVGSFDFTFDKYNWIVRGNVDYGYVGDAVTISNIKRNITSKDAPYSSTPVGKNAVATGIEAGYNIFSQIPKLADVQKLYLFGRYEYYNTYIPDKAQAPYTYTERNRIAAGLNYHPIPQVAVKAEYSHRFFKSEYNNEPSINIGVVYEGLFL